MRRSIVILLIVAAALAAASATSSAETRSGRVDDPQDMPVDISGTAQPDLQSTAVAYDGTAGRFTITGTLYGSFDSTRPPGFRSSNITVTVEKYGPNIAGVPDCGGPGYVTDASPDRVYFTLYPSSSSAGSASVSIQGINGAANVPLEAADGGRSFTLTFQHPSLAGQDYRCFSSSLGNLFNSTPATGTYNSSCGCWVRGQYDSVATGFFDGYTPQPASTTAPQPPGALPVQGDAQGTPTPRTPANPAPLPLLTGHDAAAYSRAALARSFRGVPTRHLIRSCARISRSRVACSARWRSGRFALAGPVTIWLTRPGKRTIWNYGFKINKTDRACVARGSQTKRCNRLVVVR